MMSLPLTVMWIQSLYQQQRTFTGHVHYEPLNESSTISSLSAQINEERLEWYLQKEEALFIAVAWIVEPAF